MNIEHFLKNEKDHYGKIYVDINYGIDKISPFISEKELARRKYVSRLPILKKYIDSIEAAERETDKSSFFGKFSSGKYVDLLEGYKHDKREELKQLEACTKCQCLNCLAECRFEGCGGCREGGFVAACDHEKISTVFYDNYTIDLCNEKTGKDEKYSVHAILEDFQRDKKYIIIEGIYNKEKYILYYYPGISEDSYGEITDEKEFEYVVSSFESIER